MSHKIDKPENQDKPGQPSNPGTEDAADKKANKGEHIYTYDCLNRMVSSSIAKTYTSYTYDTLGNLTLETVKNKSVDYIYNELNQLVRKTTSTNDVYTYSYDKRGNRIAEVGPKASQELVFDATNRMVSGTNWKGDESAYTYNGLGIRVNNTHTTHAGQVYARDYVIDYTSYENDDLYVYATGNGQLEYEQLHVYAGSERIEQFTARGNGNWERTLYVHEDVMGNTRYYTKTNGQSFAELEYDAWGMPVSPNKLLNNDHGNYVFATFTGHIYDTTLDIYFAEARFYDAGNRQWLSMDPVKDGLNWYLYCGANPTTYWDPLGLFDEGYFDTLAGCGYDGEYTMYVNGIRMPVAQIGNDLYVTGMIDQYTLLKESGLINGLFDYLLHIGYYSNLTVNEIAELSRTSDTFSAWKESENQMMVTYNPAMKDGPIQVTRYGSSVDIRINVQLSGDYDYEPYGYENTLGDLAIKGFESWSGTYYKGEHNGVVYDQFGVYDSVNVNVVVEQNAGNALPVNIYTNIEEAIEINGSKGNIPCWEPLKGTKWSTKVEGEIYLFTVARSEDGETTNYYDGDLFAAVAGHEIGHALGLGDAYVKNNHEKNGYIDHSNDFVYNHVNRKEIPIATNPDKIDYLNSDKMYGFGPVSANDIEMLLEAWKLNERQGFREDDHSSVIRLID